jgi:apolipoprotein N-acyltransferase
METAYDWITVGIFAGLVTLFLHRSTDADEPRDALWQYLVAGVGCAITNWLGNEEWHLLAIPALAATLAYVYFVLRPFGYPSR